MKTDIRHFLMSMSVLLCLLISPMTWAEQAGNPVFNQEELEQILAAIALYPDSLLSQILMAATYPLEVVQAQRWTEQNKSLTGQALVDALEKQTWDPSVKSLVNFPQVLTMMDEKIDWTQKLGDAFLAQQKDVMDTIQKLRKKAQAQGNLKTTDKQIVKTEPNAIIVEYANPQVVYVPTYDPVVVYGTWPYPTYPPYYYYPPTYYPGAPWVYFSCGAAWGYAWGHCDWDDADIDIDVDHNFNQGDRVEHFKDSERVQNAKEKWKHNPEHRKGVAYRDQGTAKQFNRASTSDAVNARQEFRGRTDQGLKDINRPDAGRVNTADLSQRGNQAANRPATRDLGGGSAAKTPIGGTVANRGSSLNNVNRGSNSVGAVRPPSSFGTSNRGGAMNGMNQGSTAKNYSNRGSASRQSMSRPSGGGARPGGMGGGARPGGMGGGRGGGGRGGGRR